MKRFVEFFHKLTVRNWGAPWHFIIVTIATTMFIEHAKIKNFSDAWFGAYTVLAFLVASGYEIYQFRNNNETWRGMIEDFTAGLAGYLIAAYPLLGGIVPAEFATLPFLISNITIDPAHGGDDPGFAQGDLKEKDITLTAAEILVKALGERGITVNLTRAGDEFKEIPLRVGIAEKSGSDLFLSLHCGHDTKPGQHGLRLFYNRDASKALAEYLFPELMRVYGSPPGS